MLAPEWTWWDALPVLLAAAALLIVPGAVVASLVGLRPWAAAATGPLLTTSIVATAGIGASAVSLRWSIPTLVGAVLAAWLLAAGVRLWLGPGDAEPSRARRRGREAPAMPAAGLAVASLLAAAVFVSASGMPGNIAQNPDMLFHLAVPERFLERGDISSLTATFAVPFDPGFYPAALHGLTATLVMVTGAPVVVAETSLVLVVAALVWPVGVMQLARTLLGPSGLVSWSAAVLSVAFTSLPFTVLGWGPLWSFVLGMALLPAWLLLLVLGVGPADDPAGDPAGDPGGREQGRSAGRAGALLLLAAGLPGLALAHPNAVVAGVVLGWMYSVNAAAVHAWQRRSPLRSWLPLLGVVCLGVLGAGAATALAPEGMLAQDWLQKPPFPAALATLAPVFVVLAAAAAVRAPRQWWIVAAAVTTVTVALVRTWGGVAATRWVTWPWYNDTERIRALTVLPVVLAGVSGGLVLAAWLRDRAHLSRRSASLVVGGVLLLLTAPQAIGHEQTLRSYYRPTGDRVWVSREEIEALRRLSAVLPDDAVVAENPLEGANFLAAVGPERPLLPSTQSRVAHADLLRLAAGLDTVGEDPELCRAAERWGVTHAIVGGDAFVGADPTPYAGIERVPASSAFELVTTAGPYSLYAMVRCAGGGGP